MLTIGCWIVVVVVAIISAIVVWAVCADYRYAGEIGKKIFAVILALVVVAGTFGGCYWYCNYTAAGARALKDQQSNLGNGLMREIIVTAEDGREIFYYKGKCDIETNNSDYILFEDEDGYRHIIYKGALDTILVTELPKN